MDIRDLTDGEELEVFCRAQKDPVWWAKNILGVSLWSGQEEILRSLVEHDKITISSGHAMGKDFLGAVVVLWFLYSFPGSIVITTAPCFDKETEILTENGWKLLKGLQGNEKVASLMNGELKFIKPLEFHKYKVNGEMIGYKSRDVDFLVTPNHKCYTKNLFGLNFRKTEALKLFGLTTERFSREVVWNGDDDDFTEKHYELWGFWFADGYVRYGGNHRRCDVSLTQSHYVDYAENLLKVYGKPISKYDRKDGAYNLTIYSKEISKWFYDNFIFEGHKKIPQFIKNAKKNKLRAFIKGFMYGDGSFGETDRIRFYDDKEMADDLQEIGLKAGYVTNLSSRELKSRSAILQDGRIINSRPCTENIVSFLKDAKKHPYSVKSYWYRQPYDDYVYCVTVPSGVVLVRRKGVYHWSGNSERQVQKVIWGEISKLWANSKVPLGGRMLNNELQVGENWYAIGFTTKETNQSVGKFQGFHAKNVLVLMTEAQAIEDVIYEEVDSLLVTENSKLYLAGNPLSAEGKFYDSFQDKNFCKFMFSCYDSPNVKGRKELIPGMVTYRWVKEKEEKWGKGSPLFEARVLGQFPKQSVNSLISVSALREAIKSEPANGWRVLGVDPARFGADETAFVFMNGGAVVLSEGVSGKATTETQGRIINLIKKLKPDYVVIDEGAMGAGIIDHLEEQLPILNAQGYKFELMPFKFGGKATEGIFHNLGTEAYFKVCGYIEQGKIRVYEDDTLISQLASRKYKFQTQTGKMTLEPKEDMKKRGLPSPDRADAFVMASFLSVDPDFEEIKGRQIKEDDDDSLEIFEMRLDGMTGYPVFN